MESESQSAEFWAEREAEIEDKAVRKAFRAAVKQHRKTGTPSREDILNVLRDREASDRLRRDLAQVLSLARTAGAELRERWRQLRDWGVPRFGRRSGDSIHLDFRDHAMARRLFAASEATESVEVDWLRALVDATRELHAQVSEAGLDADSIHRLGLALERVDAGEPRDVGEDLDVVELLLRELESRELLSCDRRDPAAAARPALLQQHADVAWGRAMLHFLYRTPGKQAASGDVLQAGINEAADDGSLRKRTVQETLRCLRTICQKCSRAEPCREHLGLIDYLVGKTRGIHVLTEEGVRVVERQLDEEAER